MTPEEIILQGIIDLKIFSQKELILLVAGIFSGLDFSFRSGARTALLYDTMVDLNRADDFLKVSG